MKDKDRQYLRVKEVAETLTVSAATIYRAIESGELKALRFGPGKGALRVPADALAEYIEVCERAAVTATPVVREVA
jgi:excisionase family DNA binding protein